MIIVRTPFRLPIGGGGTDLPSYYEKHGGFLLTAAIDKYMMISINQPALFDKIRVAYSRVEIVDVDQIGSIRHEIVRESLKHLGIKRPLEINSMADLAAGTGMGSSSAYTVGLLKGLNTMIRRELSAHELAEEACKVEIDLLRQPIGKQDQYAATYGGIIVLEIDKSGNVKVEPLKLDHETVHELEHRLMMFYTNIQRDANTVLADQSNKARNNEEIAVNAMHRIKQIGLEVKAKLQAGDITGFGELLHEHWMVKKSISNKMSNSDVDSWYEHALANGALGGKLMGAGGGGFFLFCTRPGMRKQLRSSMEAMGLRFMEFRFDWEGCKVVANF